MAALRKSISRNLSWKILSLILATVIWFLIRLGLQEEVKRLLGVTNPPKTRLLSQLPITLMTSAADERGFKVNPRTADVLVIGDPMLVDGLDPAEVEVFVRLTDIQETKGSHVKILYHAPNSINVLRVVPTAVEIERVAAHR